MYTYSSEFIYLAFPYTRRRIRGCLKVLQFTPRDLRRKTANGIRTFLVR